MADTAIKLNDVSKFYKLYDRPKDRLKEALHLFNKNYHKRYYALKGIDLEIQKGDILGVVGRNGCGKSTLLKLITGVLQPDEGEITVKGKITALLELGAGFNPEFTGIDNIQFYAKILGIADKEFEEKLPLIIAFAELDEFLYQPVKTYSSGMRARLGFAVAVHVNPDILILDEVLAVGDAAFQAKCYREIRKFFESGKTVILVSHSYQNIVSLCNRAILIVDGCVVKEGKPKDVWSLHKEVMFNPGKSVEEIILEMEIVQQGGDLTQTPNKATDQIIVAQNDPEIATTSKTTQTTNKQTQDTPERVAEAENVDKNILSTDVQKHDCQASLDHKNDTSKSIHYANEYGEFSGIRIVDMMSDKTVNRGDLYKNSKYRIIVKFKPFVGFINAWFGIQIRALTGVVISGVNERAFLDLPGRDIVIGETIEIETELNCLLNAGHYFISCFVLSDNASYVRAEEFVIIEVQGEEKNGGMVKILDTIKTSSVTKNTPIAAQTEKGKT